MLLVFGLNYLALLACCLGMARHHRALLGQPPSSRRVALLRGAAALGATGALGVCIHQQGGEVGTVLWGCLLMLSGILLVALLAWRPRWALPLAVGAPLAGGAIALLGAS
ncbi:DUF3325 domain-containing protein [Stigmatella aurantiaca]|uniref:Conserved uncharacterized protein n=1 Tax=Stigmatella aurantiaca (strain DW4/3-1) TaxID=378806 RepID=E3FSF7_STIAD|nr:DUF3325 domain-containing protein [Stigmatella aurantiaca]ADO72068.1 conserved uncharacterized protein [Stigmatella aurantiaca DW4/3-1]